MNPLRVAIVGTGLMGRWHADAAAHAGAIVARAVDRDAARARALARRYRRCQPSTTLLPLERDHVDVVHICTPSATHDPLASEALRSGIHVLVEKPLSETAAATERLYHLAASARVLLCPVHQFPFQAGIRRAVTLLPRIAPVRHVDLVICSAGATGAADRNADEVAVDIVPHFASILARLWPAALRSAWRIERPRGGELRMLASADGAAVSLLVSMGGRPAVNTLRIIGEQGTVAADLFHGFAVHYDPSVSRFRKIVQPFAQSAVTASAAAVNLVGRAMRRNVAYPGLRELVASFYGAIRSGGDPPITPADAIAAAAIRDLVVASIVAGGDLGGRITPR